MAAFTIEQPEEAYECLCQAKPQLCTSLYQKIFMHSLPFFSRNLLNVERDWDKVGHYTKHLNILDEDFVIRDCYTNQFLPKAPYQKYQRLRIVCSE